MLCSESTSAVSVTEQNAVGTVNVPFLTHSTSALFCGYIVEAKNKILEIYLLIQQTCLALVSYEQKQMSNPHKAH